MSGQREESADRQSDQSSINSPLVSEKEDATDSSDSSSSDSSTTSSTSSSNDTSLSDDLPSDVVEAQQTGDTLIHGHTLPADWVCKYNSATEQYRFEFIGNLEGQYKDAKLDELEVELDKSISLGGEINGDREKPSIDIVQRRSSSSSSPTAFACKLGYHFPSSPTSSMISELAKQVQKGATAAPQAKSKTKQVGYGRTKFTMPSDEEEQARRLREMFPTAPGPIVDQMIQVYHGREGLIKAALISLGYKRAVEYGSKQAAAQSPIMLMMAKPASKKLFDKLTGYFPDKDESLIKQLMFKHREVEHEIISALVEFDQQHRGGASHLADGGQTSLDPTGRRRFHDRNFEGPIMKLRYLKYLFPTCEEIELYHLLQCNNLNAQKVIEVVEQRGHKRANLNEVLENRKSQAQQMRAQQAALAARVKAPTVNPLETHKNRTRPVMSAARVRTMREQLAKDFGQLPEGLLIKALESADYNERLAREFLTERGEFNEELYKQRYKIQREPLPDVCLFPCKGVQKSAGDSRFMEVTANEQVALPRSVIECNNALALLKVDAATFTQEDFEQEKVSKAKGSKRDLLALGSIFKQLEVRDSLRRGASESLRVKSRYGQVCANSERPKPNSRAHGRQANLALGSDKVNKLRRGRNMLLLKREHPFFVAEQTPA